jgi:hypothetical protein
MLRMLIWDQMGPLGENGGSSVGKGGKSDVENRHLQCGSPRLYQFRTDGLAPANKYWTYWSRVGDMSLVNWCSIFINRCLSFSVASMVIWGEKLGGDTQIGQPTCCGLGRELSFSEAVTMSNSIESVWKVVMYVLSWAHTCHMYQVSSRGCTLIRIIMTLGYE